MINKVQAIYPSSKVPAEAKAAYGWQFARELNTRVNDQGHVVPSFDESASLRALRQQVDQSERIDFTIGDRVIPIEDFAVNYLPSAEPAQRLGLFVLSRTEFGNT